MACSGCERRRKKMIALAQKARSRVTRTVIKEPDPKVIKEPGPTPSASIMQIRSIPKKPIHRGN